MTTVKREAFTVQWSRLMDHAGHPYRGNEEALVLAPTGQAAIAAVPPRRPPSPPPGIPPQVPLPTPYGEWEPA